MTPRGGCPACLRSLDRRMQVIAVLGQHGKTSWSDLRMALLAGTPSKLSLSPGPSYLCSSRRTWRLRLRQGSS